MKDLFRIAVRNVVKRKKRAALTMLGVFIGIAAVVALISLGQGLSQTINDQFEKVGADKIIIQAKQQGGFGGQNTPGELGKRELDIATDTQGVSRAAGMLYRSLAAQYNKVQRTLPVYSLPDKADEADLTIKVQLWEAEQGRLLTHKDKNKIMIGYDLAHKQKFGRNIILGEKITLGNSTFEVIGILKKLGDPTTDGGIVLPENNLREIINEPESYSFLIAQSARTENPETVAARIERAIRKDRHQDEGKEDFNVQTSTELIASFNVVLGVIQAVFVGIAAISLLVGGIGIMNTMYTAVLERTREIGVMKAIGGRNRDILTIFIIESGLLGLAGGAIGIVIGLTMSIGVSLGANAAFGPNTMNAAYPTWLILGALFFSFSVGAFSGLLPARRASKLKPVEALRDE